ncbi:hypothetical protein WK59_11245 [Burkholderia ubonensis]|nr:hypothetical protein WK59_11245 [Burkholderia ubonensis]
MIIAIEQCYRRHILVISFFQEKVNNQGTAFFKKLVNISHTLIRTDFSIPGRILEFVIECDKNILV